MQEAKQLRNQDAEELRNQDAEEPESREAEEPLLSVLKQLTKKPGTSASASGPGIIDH